MPQGIHSPLAFVFGLFQKVSHSQIVVEIRPLAHFWAFCSHLQLFHDHYLHLKKVVHHLFYAVFCCQC